MAPLTAVQSSNSRIASALSPRLVAVFVSAISGIGEASLKQFAKHARQPRAYFIGRSKDAGDRITAECKALNPEGEYVFIQADVSLIRVVDDVCEEIEAKEKTINILFLTAGTLNGRTGMYTFSESVKLESSARLVKNVFPAYMSQLHSALSSSRVLNLEMLGWRKKALMTREMDLRTFGRNIFSGSAALISF